MKRNSIILAALAVCAIVMSSCSSTKYTRAELYSKMYNEDPVVLVVMPPINNTTNVEAKELLYTSINTPLIEAGYYVVSPHVTMELLKAESAYDAEMFVDGNVSQFGKVFGADAVVFTVIDTWKKSGFGIETKLHYIIKSTKTNEVLFERSCDLYLDLSEKSRNSATGQESTMLIASLIKTAVTDHIVAARKCNAFILSDIPGGKYAPWYKQDGETTAQPRDIKASVR